MGLLLSFCVHKHEENGYSLIQNGEKRMTDSMQFQSSSGNDHSTEECDKRKEKNLRYRKTYFEKGSYYLGKG